MNKRFLWTLSAGHTCADLNQGALPAMLPFLILAGGLSYSSAAGLTFAMALSSSVIQPAFGIWADKISKPWLMPAGLLLAGISLALIGFTDNYWLMFTLAIFSGIGVAAFHPEAARMANYAAGEKKGTGMSIFSLGGNIGFALGPILATPAMLWFGLKGSFVLAIPAIIMFSIMLLQMNSFAKNHVLPETKKVQIDPTKKDEWGKFSWLTLAIIARSIIFVSINTFLPLYWINVLHQSEAAGGTVLTIMFVTGAISTYLGGILADRIGSNNIVRIGYVLLIPCIYFLTSTKDVQVATLLLFPLAFSLFSISSPMVLLGQKYLPNKIGFASGITLGLALSVGGLLAPLIGKYADQNGLDAAMSLIVLIPIFASFVVWTLKKPAIELK